MAMLKILLKSTLLCLFFLIVPGCRRSEEVRVEQKEVIRIAVPNDIITGPVLIAQRLEFIEDEGLEVVWDNSYSSGKAAFQAMLRGEADISLVATTPVVFESFARDDFVVFVTFTTSYEAVKIISRSGVGIETADDLRGKRVGILSGTISQILLDSVLIYHEILPEELEIIDSPPAEMSKMLADGRLDAISSWSNYIFEARQLLGDDFIDIPTSKAYRIAINMAAAKELTNSKPEVIEKVVRGLLRAEKFLDDSPEESRRLLAEILNQDLHFIERDWDHLNFSLTLDQLLIITMENEASWAIRYNYIEKKRVPNYLDFIYYQALEKEKPEAVTIIRDLK